MMHVSNYHHFHIHEYSHFNLTTKKTHLGVELGPVGQEVDVQLKAVVGPGAELEEAALLVKGEEECVE